MFHSIVVGTDGSSRARTAVAAASEMARVHGAKLHLVRAYRPSLQSASLAAGDAVMAIAPSTDAEIHAQVEQDLERMAAELEREGVAVQTYACPQSAPS